MTDDEYLVQRLRLLDDEPSGPTRVDLPPPIEPGPVATGAAPADPASGAIPHPDRSAEPSRPAPPTGCVIERLPIPGEHPMSLVTGADPTGRFILGRSYPSRAAGAYPVLIWDDGRATRITLPGVDQSLTDVTTTGVAVGAGWDDQGPEPYLVRNGRVTRLPVTGSANARAINEAGQIVGTRDGRQPVLWPAAGSAPVDLPLPGPDWRGEAVDIDEDGTVVGVISTADGRTEQGYLWLPDRTGRVLPGPTVRGRRWRRSARSRSATAG